MRPGDLVLWTTPGRRVVLGLLLTEVMGHGGGLTGWWSVLSDVGVGVKTYLTRAAYLVTVAEGP